MSKPNEYDTYIIPPNFIEGGTFFGGLLKLRNTAEALVIVLAIGIPVFSVSALTLTAKIIILCLTALPLGIIALVGINGESLSSFIFLVLKYLCNRRIITRNEEGQDKRKKRKKRKVIIPLFRIWKIRIPRGNSNSFFMSMFYNIGVRAVVYLW